MIREEDMKYFYLTIFLILCLYGCKSVKKVKLPSEEHVKEVIFLLPDYSKSNDTNTGKFKKLFRLSDSREIQKLLLALKKTTGKANETFSGSLPTQLFIDKNEKPLFNVEIICNDSSVFIGSNIKLHNEILTYDINGTDIADGINRKYVKLIYAILKKRAPEEVKKLEKRYKNQGGIEKILFPK